MFKHYTDDNFVDNFVDIFIFNVYIMSSSSSVYTGDVINYGNVNNDDIIEILTRIATNNIHDSDFITNGDITGKGYVDVSDAQYIHNWMAAGGSTSNLGPVTWQDNGKSYTITPNINNLSHKYLNYVYDNSDTTLTTIVNTVKNIIYDIAPLPPSNSSTISINFYIRTPEEDSYLGDGTLGYADTTNNVIVLNKNLENNTTFSLISKTSSINDSLTVVCIHEVLHILGIVNITNDNTLIDKTDSSRTKYIGAKGVQKYKDLLDANSQSINATLDLDNINYLPIEDNGGGGTANVHFEEGYIDDNFSQYDSSESPVLENEIMTGWIDPNNFITPITLGVLEDMGYIVNYDSTYVVLSNTAMKFNR